MSSIQPKGQSFHHTGVSTFAIRTSQRTSQKLQKSLSVFHRFFCRPEKQNQVGGKHGSDVARMKRHGNPAGNRVGG